MGCKAEGCIDLHIHSNASDGTLTPEEIIESARKLKLGAIAITDHDTVEGSKKAIEYGIPSSLRFISGVEISTSPPAEFPCSGSFHILGYLIRLDDPELNRTLNVLQSARKNRNPGIIKQLNRLGFDISFSEIEEKFNGGQLGRPHIARLMVEKGYVGSVDEAFDVYLGKGKPAYVEKFRIDCQKAIEMISSAGGVPVLAHPGLLKPVNKLPLEKLIGILTSFGLKGIEVYYPQHSAENIRLFQDIAERYNLILTGGTDFHGAIKPDIEMGYGRGNFSVPYTLFEKLIEGRCLS